MWYEGKVLERNGDQNPVVLWLLIKEYLVRLGFRPFFAKFVFLSMLHTPPLKNFNTSDSAYANHILGNEVWAS